MTIRQASLAGSWYPADPGALARQLESCFAAADRAWPAPPDAGHPLALVVPHAGLAYSGPVAAAAYRLVRDSGPRPDVFVIFGACHRARLTEPAVWSRGEWETPLGPATIDSGLADAMLAAGLGSENERPHAGDNAIELQLPFIKWLFPEAMIVPVAVSPTPDSWRRGAAAAAAAAEYGSAVVAIASTDLTHYGSSFGVTPAGTGEPALAWMRENDKRFLRLLETMDMERIVPTAERDGSACGGGAAAAAAGWAKALGANAGRLLAYTTSYDVMPQGEAEHMVGYAALAYSSG